MGNDMTWEQKCRISALRAACASQFTIFGVPTDLTMPPDVETDEHMTKRILARAEAFRIALMGDGALDYTPDDDEAPEASMELSNCKYCTRAIGKHDDGTWIDNTGTRYCGSAQTLIHAPNALERVLPGSNRCPECWSSRKNTPVMIPDGFGDNRQCVNAWHKEVSTTCARCGTAIGQIADDGRWFDNNGQVLCGTAGILMHRPAR